jgi:hypothetical protein
VPVSYEATDPPPLYEEDEEGNINQLVSLDDGRDDLEDEEGDHDEQ